MDLDDLLDEVAPVNEKKTVASKRSALNKFGSGSGANSANNLGGFSASKAANNDLDDSFDWNPDSKKETAKQDSNRNNFGTFGAPNGTVSASHARKPESLARQNSGGLNNSFGGGSRHSGGGKALSRKSKAE